MEQNNITNATVPVPLRLLQDLLLVLDQTAAFQPRHIPDCFPSDNFHWRNNTPTDEKGEVYLTSDDVKKVIKHSIEAIEGVVAQYRKTRASVEAVEQMLKVEKDRIDWLLRHEQKLHATSERDREKEEIMSAADAEGSGHFHDFFDADHGY